MNNKYSNNHYVQRAFIEDFFNQKEVWSWKQNVKNKKWSLKRKNIKNAFVKKDLYITKEEKERNYSMETLLNNAIEKESLEVLRKIKNTNLNEDIKLERKETFLLRKYLFINFLRHPINFENFNFNKEEWLDDIKFFINYSFEDLQKTTKYFNVVFEKVNDQKLAAFFWKVFMNFQLNFVTLDSDVDFLLPANACNSIFLSNKDSSLEWLSNKLKINIENNSDVWNVYSILTKSKMILLLDTDLKKTIMELSIKAYEERKFWIIGKNDVPGFVEGLYLNWHERYYKEESLNNKKDNLNFDDLDKRTLDDFFVYKWTKMKQSSINWKIDLLKTIQYEELIFTNLDKMEKALEDIIECYEYCEYSSGAEKTKDIYKLIIWKNISSIQYFILYELLKQIKRIKRPKVIYL